MDTENYTATLSFSTTLPAPTVPYDVYVANMLQKILRPIIVGFGTFGKSYIISHIFTPVMCESESGFKPFWAGFGFGFRL